jgi:hypothetical protein
MALGDIVAIAAISPRMRLIGGVEKIAGMVWLGEVISLLISSSNPAPFFLTLRRLAIPYDIY